MLREEGDPVIGATLNGSGTIVLRATHVGRDAVLGQIVRMVREAQGSKAPIQRLADRVTEWFVPAGHRARGADLRGLAAARP